MVIKVRSEEAIKPLRNVTQYDTWKMPSIEQEGAKVFRQEPIEQEEIEKEETVELISQEEIQKLKDQAYAEGFEKGRKEGLESAKTEIDSKIRILDNMVQQLTEPLQQCGEQTQQELVELAFAISRQIVRRELKQDPTQLIAIIRESLNLLPIGSQNIQILLHPEDASIVRDVLSIDKESSELSWKLINDPSMERGGCLLKTDNSKVNASVDKQIAVLFSRIIGGQRAGESNADG